MKLVIKIDLENDAFSVYPYVEVLRILSQWGLKCLEHKMIYCAPLRDVNGNVVGSADTVD